MRPVPRDVGQTDRRTPSAPCRFGFSLMDFAKSFRIGRREVGPGAPCLIIAEAGVSHFGDMGLARDLVDLAADAGADAFKTQVFDVERLIARRADDWRERLRARNLTLDECGELQGRGVSLGVAVLTDGHGGRRTPWS